MTHLTRSTTVLLLLATLAHAQIQLPANTTRIKGTISSIAANKRVFVLVDKKGTQITVALAPTTQYLLGGTDAKLVDVLVPGDKVNVNITPAGIAANITNKNKGSRPTSAQLQDALGLSDEECDALVPLIVKVQSLKQQSQRDGINGSPLRNAADALKAATKDPSVPKSDLAMYLRALHTARAKAQSDYQKATQDLTSLLTIRQEALLVQMGILE